MAPDSYKGSLSSFEVAAAMELGIRRVIPTANIIKIPIADGGEGTVDAILASLGGKRYEVEVLGPLGESITAQYGVLQDGFTAVLEMASASGLPLLPLSKRNPWKATTFGTGQMMKHAIQSGCRRIWIGIGGSATNDGGMGMAQALGVRFLNADGNVLGIGADQLEHIDQIDCSGMDPRWVDVELIICSDVTNPLCGSKGASVVFGPQKGANPDMVIRLDQGLTHYAERIHTCLGKEVQDIQGVGAAGGLGAGLLAFCGGRIVPGIQFMMELVGMEEAIRHADLVITGEGRVDEQTSFGKVPSGIGQIAQKVGVPVVCLSGSIGNGVENLYEHGITAMFSVMNSPMTLDDALNNAGTLISLAMENVIRLFVRSQ